jgi:hypothetical protein
LPLIRVLFDRIQLAPYNINIPYFIKAIAIRCNEVNEYHDAHSIFNKIKVIMLQINYDNKKPKNNLISITKFC